MASGLPCDILIMRKIRLKDGQCAGTGTGTKNRTIGRLLRASPTIPSNVNRYLLYGPSGPIIFVHYDIRLAYFRRTASAYKGVRALSGALSSKPPRLSLVAG